MNRLRVCGRGVDCVQFVYAVLEACQIVPVMSFDGYDTSAGLWKEDSGLERVMLEHFHAEWVESGFQFGDIFITKTGKQTAHCGFFDSDGHLWHALAGRCVTKSDFVLWRRGIKGMVRIVRPGLRKVPSGRLN